MREQCQAVNDSNLAPAWWSLNHRLAADRAFFEDYSEWSAYRLIRSSRELLDAFEASESRNDRRDFAARLALNHREALETFGALCHGLRNRGNGPAIRGILNCCLAEARDVLKTIRSQPDLTFGKFFNVEAEMTLDASVPSEYDGDLLSFCEDRRKGLIAIAEIAAQSTLFQFHSPGSGRYLLTSSGKTVAEIKTGFRSEMRAESNSGFFLVDISASNSKGDPELLGIAAPAVPGILRSSVGEIDFMAQEGAAIASFAAGLARSGYLYADSPPE